MKNPAPYIRKALVALLNETITYDAVDVPCYSGNGETTKYQILIKSPTDTNISTRDSFNGKWEVIIEVVSEQVDNTDRHIDSIGGSVLETLLPTPNTSTLVGNSVFQVSGVRKEGQRYLAEKSGEGTFINRLIIRLSFYITQI